MNLSELLQKPKFLAADPDEQEDVIDTYVEATRQEVLSGNGLGGDPRKYFKAVEEAEMAKAQLGLTKDTRSISQILKDQFVEGLNSSINATVALQAVSGIKPPDEAAAEIAANALEDSQKPKSRAMLKYQKAGDRGWSGPILNVLTNPQAAAEITAQGLGTSVPGLVTGGVAAGLASYLKGGPMVRALATAGAVGASSAFVEGGSQILEDLQAEAGGDLTNTEAVTQALSNPEILTKLRERAVKRGMTVGAFDAASVLSPSSRILGTARGLKGMATKGALDTLIQGGLGGAGELAGNVAIGEQTNPSDFWAEVIGEVLPGVAETVIAGRGDLTPETDQAVLEKARQNQARVFSTGTVAASPILRKKQASDFNKDKIPDGAAAKVLTEAQTAATPTNETLPTVTPGASVAPVLEDQPKGVRAPEPEKIPEPKAEKELTEEERKAPFVIHNSGVGTSSAVGALAKKYNMTVQPTAGTQDTEQLIAGDLDRADAVVVVGNEETLRDDPGQMQQRRVGIKGKKPVIMARDANNLLLQTIDFLRKNPKAKNFAVAMPQSTAINTTGEAKQQRISEAETILDTFFDTLSQLDPDPAKRDYTDLENQIREASGQTRAKLVDPKTTTANMLPGWPYATRGWASNWLLSNFEGPQNANNVLVFQTDPKNTHRNIHGPIAKKLGAESGRAGPSGQTYAIPYFKKEKVASKKKLSREEDEAGLDIGRTSQGIQDFLEYAAANPEKTFYFMPDAYSGGFSQLDERRLFNQAYGKGNKGMRLPGNVRMVDSALRNIFKSNIRGQNPMEPLSWEARGPKRGVNEARILNLDRVENAQFRPIVANDPSLDPAQAEASRNLARAAAEFTKADRLKGIPNVPPPGGLVIPESQYKRYLRPAIVREKASQEKRAIGTPESGTLGNRGVRYRPRKTAGDVATTATSFPFIARGISKSGQMYLQVRNVREIGTEVPTAEAEAIAQLRPGSLEYLNALGAEKRYLVEVAYGSQVPTESIYSAKPSRYTVRTTPATASPSRKQIESQIDLDQLDEPIDQAETEVTFGAQSLILRVPMRYNMPANAVRKDLKKKYPKGTSTLQLIQDGNRKATTRRAFASVGDIISFENDPAQYIVTSVAVPDLTTPEGRASWENLEGWSLDYIDKDPKLKAQVYSPNAVQTIFERYTKNKSEKNQRLVKDKIPQDQGYFRPPISLKLKWDAQQQPFVEGIQDPKQRGIQIPYANFDNMVMDILEENKLPVSGLIEKEVPLFRQYNAQEIREIEQGLKRAREIVDRLKPGQTVNRSEQKKLRPFLDLISRHVELQSIVRDAYQGKVMGWGTNTPRNYVKLMAAKLINDEKTTVLVPSGNVVQPMSSEAAIPDPIRRFKDGALESEVTPAKAIFTSNTDNQANSLLLLDDNDNLLQTLGFSFRHKDIFNSSKINVVSQDALVTPGTSIVRVDLENEGKWQSLTEEEKRDLSWFDKGPSTDSRMQFVYQVARMIDRGEPVGIADPDSVAFVKAHRGIFQFDQTLDGLIINGVKTNFGVHSIDAQVPGLAGDFSKIFYRVLKPFFQVQEDEFNRGIEFSRPSQAIELMRDKPTRTLDYRGREETSTQAPQEMEGATEAVGSTVPATTEDGRPILSLFSRLERSEEMVAGQRTDSEIAELEQEENERISQTLKSLRQHLLIRPELAAVLRQADPEGRYVKMIVLPQLFYQASGAEQANAIENYPAGSAIVTGITDPVSGEKLGSMEALIGRSPEAVQAQDEVGQAIRQAFADRQERGRHFRLPEDVDYAQLNRAYNNILRTLTENPGSVYVFNETESSAEQAILKGLEAVTSFDRFDDKIHFTGVYDTRNKTWIGQLPYGERRYTVQEISALPREQVLATAQRINKWLDGINASVDRVGVDDPSLTDDELKSRLQLLQIVAKTYLEGTYPYIAQAEKEMVEGIRSEQPETTSGLTLDYVMSGDYQQKLGSYFKEPELQILPVLLDHAAQVFNTGIVYYGNRAGTGDHERYQGRPREHAINHFRKNTTVSEQDAHNLIDRLAITTEGAKFMPLFSDNQPVRFRDAELFRRLFLDAMVRTRAGTLRGEIGRRLDDLIRQYAQDRYENPEGMATRNPPAELYNPVIQLVTNSFRRQGQKEVVRFLGLVDRVQKIQQRLQLPAAPVELKLITPDAGRRPQAEDEQALAADLTNEEATDLQYQGEDYQTLEEIEKALISGTFDNEATIDPHMEGSEKLRQQRRFSGFLQELSKQRDSLPFVQRMVHDIVLKAGWGIKNTQFDPRDSRSNAHADYTFERVRSHIGNDYLKGSEIKKAVDLIDDFPPTFSDPKVLGDIAEERYNAVVRLLDEFVHNKDTTASGAAQILENFKRDVKADREYSAELRRKADALDITVKDKRDKAKKREQEVSGTTREKIRQAEVERQFASQLIRRTEQIRRFETSMAEALKDSRYATLRLVAETALDELIRYDSAISTRVRSELFNEIFGPQTRTLEEAGPDLEQSRERERLYKVVTGGLLPFYAASAPFSRSSEGIVIRGYEINASLDKAVFRPERLQVEIGRGQLAPNVFNFEALLDALRTINQPFKVEARAAQAARVLENRTREVRAFNVHYGQRSDITVDERLASLQDPRQVKAFNLLQAMARQKRLNGVHFALGTNSRHPVYTTFNTANSGPDPLDNTIFVNPRLLAEKLAVDSFDVAYIATEVVNDQTGEVSYQMNVNREVGEDARKQYEALAQQLANNYLTHEVAHLAYMNQIRRDYAALYNGTPPAGGFGRYYRNRTDDFASFLKDPDNGLKVKQPGRKAMSVLEAIGSLYELGPGQSVNNDTLVAEFFRMMLEIEKSGGTIITEITEETRREMSGVPGITRFIEFMRTVLDAIYSLFQGLRNSNDPRAADLYVTYQKVSSLYDNYFNAYMESNLETGEAVIEPGSRIVPVFGAGYQRPERAPEALSRRFEASVNGNPEDVTMYKTRGIDETIAKLRDTGAAEAIEDMAGSLDTEDILKLLQSDPRFNDANPDQTSETVLRGVSFGQMTELDKLALVTLAIGKLKFLKQFAKARTIAKTVSSKLRGMGQTISIVGRMAEMFFLSDPAEVVAEYAHRIAEGRKHAVKNAEKELQEILDLVKPTQTAAIGSVLGEQKVQALISTINRLYGEELRRQGIENIEAILKDHYTGFSGESLLAVLSRLLPARKLEDRTLESLVDTVEENMRIQLANRLGFGGRTVSGKIIGRKDNTDMDLKEERISQILEKMAKAAKAPIVKSGRSIENAIAGDAKMILELAAKQALDRETVLGVIQSLGKFPSFNLQTAQQLRDMVEKAASLPLDSFMRTRELQKALGVLQNATQPMDSTWAGLFSPLWYMSLLSGPATFMLNFFSTKIKAMADMASYAIAAGWARKDFRLAGRLLSLSFKTFYQSMYTIALAEAKGILLKGDINTRTAGKYITEESLNALETLDTNTIIRKILSLGKYVFRIMSASDAFFGRASLESYAHVQAYLKAIEQVEQGKTQYTVEQEAARLIAQTEQEGKSFSKQAEDEGLIPGTADFTRRVYELRDQTMARDPERSAIIRRAEEMSLFATYNNDPYGVLGDIGKAIGQFNRSYPLGILVVPFTKIVSNVTNESLNYTPIIGPYRALKELKDSDFKLGEKAPGYPTTQAELERVSKIERGYQLTVQSILGTGMLAGVWAAAHLGLRAYKDDDDEGKEQTFMVTGSGPKDPAALRQAREGGYSAYSLTWGGNFRLNYMATPLAVPLAVVGAWMDNERFQRGREDTPYETLMSAVLAGVQVPFNQSFLQGLSTLFSIVDGRFDGEDRSAAEKLIGSSVGNLVPNIARQIEQLFVPVPNTQTTLPGKLLYGKFPVIRNMTGKPTLNVLGEPVTAPVGAERYFFLQRFVNTMQADPLFKLLMEKDAFIPDTKRSDTVGNMALTDAEYYRYREIRGQFLGRLLRNQEFYNFARKADRAQIKEYLSKAASRATRAAKRQMAQELIASGINPMDGSLLTEGNQ